MSKLEQIVLGIFVSCLLTSSPLLAGTVRYELPQLLGEHVYDGPDYWGRLAQVETSLSYYSADSAKLVVEGTVAAGRARGDGILREALEFDLLPAVSASAYLPGSSSVDFIGEPSPLGSFRIEKVYPRPLDPQVVLMPSPDGYPPILLAVSFSVRPIFVHPYPPLLHQPQPGDLTFHDDGIIVNEPLVANVTKAYILITGPHIVPEPASGFLLLPAFVLALTSYRRGRCFAH